RYYAKLSKLGHELGYLDVGGGLGVDYDGSRSDFDSSTNYSLQEYANDVVWNIMDVCDSESVAHPAIVSESGRATVAHHSVQVAHQIVNMHRGLRYVPDEVKQLEITLGDQYICNFSVFQSLLDHWALGQLFPIMPIHRLTTPPDRHGTIVDITCDSDGRVCKF